MKFRSTQAVKSIKINPKKSVKLNYKSYQKKRKKAFLYGIKIKIIKSFCPKKV